MAFGISKQGRAVTAEAVDLAEKVVNAGSAALMDPSGVGLAAAGTAALVKMACQLWPERDLEAKLAALRREVAKQFDSHLLRDQLACETALGLLERVTPRDVYAAREDVDTWVDTLLRSAAVTPPQRPTVHRILHAFWAGYHAVPEVGQAIETLFRQDMRQQMHTLREQFAQPSADIANALRILTTWVQRDILYDPRNEVRRRRRGVEVSARYWLEARHEVVPFFGRKAELATCADWLASDEAFDVMIVEGPGGIGKTRLLLEALGQARRSGWAGGFLRSPGGNLPDLEPALHALATGSKPVLMVMDYAADRPDLAAQVLHAWDRDGGTKRRLVLIARSRSFLLSALERHVADRDRQGSMLRDSLEWLRSRVVTVLDRNQLRLPLAERHALFVHAQQAFKRVVPDAADTCYPAESLDDAYFDQPHFGSNLYVQIAALASLNGQRPAVRRDDLLAFVLRREWDHLTPRLKPLRHAQYSAHTDRRLHQTLALTTLTMTARSESNDPGPTLETLLRATRYTEGWTQTKIDELVRVLTAAYSHAAGNAYADALRPDALGEALVHQTVNDEESVGLYRTLYAVNADAFASDLAMSLNKVSVMYSNLGRREEALASTEESVGLYRTLYVVNADAFASDLARSLGNWGYFTGLAGDWRQAVTAYTEALGVLLPLVLRYPQAFRNPMDFIVAQYPRACEHAGVPVDSTLLQPLLPHYPELASYCE